MSAKQKLAGKIRSNRRAAFYQDVLPLIAEWTEEGLPQKDIAGLLNGMNKRNYHGFPYNAMMIGRIMRQAPVSETVEA